MRKMETQNQQQKREVTGRVTAVNDLKEYKKGAGFRLALDNMQEEVGFWCPTFGRAKELAGQIKVGATVSFFVQRNEKSGYLNGSELIMVDEATAASAPKQSAPVIIPPAPAAEPPKPVNPLDYDADAMAKAQVMATCLRQVRLLCDADERSQAEARGKMTEDQKALVKYVILGPDQVQGLVSTLFIEVCKEMRIQRKIRDKWGD